MPRTRLTPEQRKARQHEHNWRVRGVKQANGKPLTEKVFRAVVDFQGKACALCNKMEMWAVLHADHDRRTGLFRGALCGDDNRFVVGTFERTGHFRGQPQEVALRFYLADPPYQRWLRH